MGEVPGLTVGKFVAHFRASTGWSVEGGTRIERELTEFATERLGSMRDIDELHVIFCLAHGIQPYHG